MYFLVSFLGGCIHESPLLFSFIILLQDGHAYSLFTSSDAGRARDLIKILREANQDVPDSLQSMASSGGGRGGGRGSGRGYGRGYGQGRQALQSGSNAMPLGRSVRVRVRVRIRVRVRLGLG